MYMLPLFPDEVLIGQGMMAYLEHVLGSICTVWRGIIYVTNRSVCYRISWIKHLKVELNLFDISGFEVGRHWFTTKVTIYSKDGERFPFTGFPAKKLQRWLEQVGVRRLE